MDLFRRINETGLLMTVVALGTLALASCGGNEESSSGTSTERAFLQGMVPHHESAVQMAQVAQRRARHAQIKRLADGIVALQRTEIAEMRETHQRLFGEELEPDERAHEKLGLSASEAGMMHGARAATMLGNEKPFDRAFIDRMVPHHAGAIRMARVLLADTNDPELRGLARNIISAQSQEIAQMNRWRMAWYGSASPAGGMSQEDGGGEMDSMEHEGH